MAAPMPAAAFGLSTAFDPFSFLSLLLDDAGANDVPDQTDMNAMTRADNVTNRLAVVWTWDDINAWTGTGQTGDACALFDSDSPGNGNVDFAICVRIHNDPSGANILQLPAGQSPLLWGCSDKKTDRCSSPVTGPLTLGNTICEVVKAPNGFVNGDDGQDALAGCIIDLPAIGVTRANLLNVCSYPSGSPNSNAFDCVVTPGAGFLQIAKKTIPQNSGTTFNFTLNPASTNGSTTASLTDNTTSDETTGLIPMLPGNNISVTETVPTGWALTAASCVRSGNSTGTKNANAVTGISIATGETTVCTFENNGAPSLDVTKTANPTSILETGGSVTYTVRVDNTAATAVTLTVLTDDKFGDLNGQGTCATGGSIAVGGNFTCTFTKTLPAGAPASTHVNVVTATVSSGGGTATDTDDATVTYTDVTPTITVDKSASPTSVPETGGTVTYSVVVTNNASEAFTLNTLSDNVFGNLDGQGTCDVPQTINPSPATYSCSFTKTVSGNAGGSHVNTVTASGTDNDGNPASDTDDATVTFTDVLPDISVTKTANPTSVPETGGSVTYTVLVTNNSAEPFSLTTLSDDKFGNLNGQGTCTVPRNIAGNGTTSCTFTKSLAGNASTSHTNTVTVTGQDDEGNPDSATDDATVTFTNVAPSISVTKVANPTSLSTVATGALNFSADQTFTTNPPPGGGGAIFVKVCDTGGPNDINSDQVDLNCMERADNVSGKLIVKWTWDDINSWTGSGQTGDGCALIDTNNDGNVNIAICARIQNNASGTQIVQVPSAGHADVYQCTDSKNDRCASPGSLIANILTTTCTVAQVAENFPNQGSDGFDIEATCSIDLNMPAFGSGNRDLLNVCTFPSGQPNSNPFDCVVTPGSGFLQIQKVTNPASSQLSGFTLSPAAINGFDTFAVAGGVTTSLLVVAPGTNYSLTETLITGWQVDDITCIVDNQSTGTENLGSKSITNFQIKTGQTTVCTFTNSGLITGPVTYTVTVTNNSSEAVNLFSLIDNQFGDLTDTALNPGSTCVLGNIAGNQSRSCTFTKTLTGAIGTSHTNTVTAVGKDDEGGSDTKTASATVSFIAPP